MYCNMCGKEIADDSRFCNICGAKVITLEAKVTNEPDVEENKMSVAKQALLIAGATIVGLILAGGILLFTISLISYL
ncbi:MAG: zinc-ribbon domain-containing protein [Lachnospiraceae bacterium]|nr:zinc-ribbon domain-containing protein [Lachnospiraceae bacterium]MBQ4068653.1 zinc-ribbon domain-containing protein [Lachnospiraceae bacterium]